MLKTIKKISTILVGTLMIAGSMVGASATTLGDYPSNFIQDGKFNGAIIVGQNAAASDVIGCVDIATNLQYHSTTVKEVVTSSEGTITINEGVKLEKSGDQFNLGESISDVKSKFDEGEFPEILSEGEYKDDQNNKEDYIQELEFSTGAGELKHYFDENDVPEAGIYFHLQDNQEIYSFLFEFDNGLDNTDTDAEDVLETTKITIQGQEYTITDIDVDSNDKVDKIELQKGDTTVWLEEGLIINQANNGVSHEVKLIDVNEQETKCGIDVDGSLTWVDIGGTQTINGLDIGVVDAITVHSAGQDSDVCEVNLGATALVLENSQEVEVNNLEIEGSETTFLYDGDELKGFRITYELKEDTFLTKGDSWVDPVLGNFEINYVGITENTEQIKIDITSSDEAEISFINNDGKKVIIPFNYDKNEDIVSSGKEPGKYVLRDNTSMSSGIGFDDGTFSDSMEDTSIFTVSSNGESHMLRIENIDETNNEIEIEDLTEGKTYTETFDETSYGNDQTIELGTYMNIKLRIENNFDGNNSQDSLHAVNSEMANAETKLGGLIDFDNPTDDEVNIYLTENPNYYEEATLETITTTIQETNGELFIQNIDTNADFINKKDDSDIEVARTEHGTLITTDTDDDDYVIFGYPEESVYGNIFVSPTGAEITTTENEGAVIETTVVNRIVVNAAKLDSEITDITSMNAIVVGGPCVNSAAAILMGHPEKCWESIPENKAIIKLYEDGNNVAILVAGRNALNTRMASKVLAHSSDYDLIDKTEVEVTGTSLSDIQVSVPSIN